MPIGYARTFTDPRYNWMYTTEPEPQLDNRTAFRPRGKVLGGSSSINAMVFVRGQPSDYDDWRSAGNPGWGWQDVLPYFRKLEDHAWGASKYHGAGGPVHVHDPSAAVHPLCTTFLESLRRAGYRYQSRSQRLRDRRRGSLAGHDPRRCAGLERERLPAAGVAPTQPRGRRAGTRATRVLFSGTVAPAWSICATGQG